MKNNPLYQSVCAGSPTPVEDGEAFDLASHLIRRPQDTSYIRVSGNSMQDAGVFDGDILIVDKSLEPHPSDIVIAQIDGGFTVKRFQRENGRLRLVPANPNYSPIDINEDARICGVARFSIHPL